MALDGFQSYPADSMNLTSENRVFPSAWNVLRMSFKKKQNPETTNLPSSVDFLQLTSDYVGGETDK